MEVEGRKEIVNFIVVHSYSPYTAILGRPWIRAIGALPSSLHQKVKFPTKQGIVKVRKDQSVAQRCQVLLWGIRRRKILN